MKKTRNLAAVAISGMLGSAGFVLPAPVQAQGAAARPKVDAKLLEILKQADAAYKSIGSYQSTLKVEEYKDGGANKPARTATGTILWRRPNQFAVALTENGSTVNATSDGATMFASTTTDKTRYTKAAAPKGEAALAKALAGSSAATLLLPSLLSGGSLVEMLGLEGAQNTTTLTRGVGNKVGGEDVDLILATQVAGNPQSGARTQYAFALGKDDHLLRQVKVSDGGLQRPFALRAVETISGVKSAAGTDGVGEASAFTFAPDERAEQVLSLEGPRYGNTLKVGGKPFDFAAPDLQGQPVNLEQYKGKVVLIDFWATWCPPCVEEMPNILSAYEMYSSEGFDVIGVSLDSDREALDQYIEQNNMKWRQVFDGKAWKSRVPGIYEVKSIPFSVLVGRDGKITAINPRGPKLRDAVENALSESAGR